MIATTYLETPIGPLRLDAEDGALVGLTFEGPGPSVGHDAVLDRARAELAEYFAGERTRFDVPIRFRRGTDFQRRVWRALSEIPFGETRSYGEIARAIGKPGSSRAVGGANHVNPIGIIVPCHRVIGSDGSLTGYGGGLETKAFLLSLERERKSTAGPPNERVSPPSSSASRARADLGPAAITSSNE